MSGKKKIRDIVYGFIELDEQECEVINHPVFQRLRRIKQLSLTDMVYPGATHTRFEHSLGVMQMASDMYDCIIAKNSKILEEEHSLHKESGVKRYRKIIRLAALLHDVGHAPFSHSGEDLMPLLPKEHHNYTEGINKKYEHEEYSIEIIKHNFKHIIEEHPLKNSYPIKVEEVTALLGDKAVKLSFLSLLLKQLISGQLDADRADYLLRDSHHLGVAYGLYDRNRLINCMTLGRDEGGSLVITVEEKGWHVAESLVLARYQMFTQVYFHKVRRIYDYHICCAAKQILEKLRPESKCYPTPIELAEYISYDDWAIYSELKKGNGGMHGEYILNRKHYKCIYETQIIPTKEDQKQLQKRLADLERNKKESYLDDMTFKAWYRVDTDLKILDGDKTKPLSEKSIIVKSMTSKPMQKRLYVKDF